MTLWGWQGGFEAEIQRMSWVLQTAIGMALPRERCAQIMPCRQEELKEIAENPETCDCVIKTLLSH